MSEDVIAGIDKRSPQKAWQGEGPYNGQRIVILRLMGCNLKCHWNLPDGRMAWCDTKYTWDGSEQGESWPVAKLIDRIVHVSKQRLPAAEWENTGKHIQLAMEYGRTAWKQSKIVMITGGEPMLRQSSPAFQRLVEGLREAGLKIHIETNGTVPPNEWARQNIDFFDMSPKYQLYREKYSASLIKEWETSGVQIAWKFVLGRQQDMWELREFLEGFKVSYAADIWLMPLTDDTKRMEQALDVMALSDKSRKEIGMPSQTLGGGASEAFKQLGWKNVRVSPRLQVSHQFP